MRLALAALAAAIVAGCGSEEETSEPAAPRDCDTTRDRYGPQTVSSLQCEGLREANGVLEGTGCDEAP